QDAAKDSSRATLGQLAAKVQAEEKSRRTRAGMEDGVRNGDDNSTGGGGGGDAGSDTNGEADSVAGGA
ncbi:unnamed protein product, partial [Ectocarpus sp. 13 AM-2016]